MSETNTGKSSAGWNQIAYMVIKYNHCKPDYVIGYYNTETLAHSARLGYIEEKNLKENGICCSKSEDCKVEAIEIMH